MHRLVLTLVLPLFVVTGTNIANAITVGAYTGDVELVDLAPREPLSFDVTYGVFIKGNIDHAFLTLTTPKNISKPSWGSTKLILEGADDVCINHGNHPLEPSKKYQQELEILSPDEVGTYTFLIQPFVSDDCQTELASEIVRKMTVREGVKCLNCGSVEKDSLVDAQSEDTSKTEDDSSVTTVDDISVRQERKRRLDAFTKLYENDPEYGDIIVLIKLFIALDIIQI